MARNARFQRYQEQVRKGIQRLKGWLARVRTCITWLLGLLHRIPGFLMWLLPSVLVFLIGLSKAIENGGQKAIELMRRYPVSSLLIMAVIICLSLWVLPLCHVAGSNFGNDDYKRLERINDARKTIAQIWAGVVVLAGLGFTWYRIEVAREGQITERFTRAIDQLGATDEHGNKRLEIRLGGIYALERIARDSEKDHWPIMEVLTAYLREHAPWKENSLPLQPQPPASEVPSSEENASQQPEPQSRPTPDADIQAILTVIGRRTRWYGKGEDQHLDLRGTDLRGANLSSVHLERALLHDAHLEGADLIYAHLEGASLHEAHLQRANLGGAHLQRADLINANLKGAFLISAHLEGADLIYAHLEGANLIRAHLREATLIEAHLEGANLDGTHLEGVNLSRTQGLTREQLAVAFTDENPLLPYYLFPDYLTPTQAADDEDT